MRQPVLVTGAAGFVGRHLSTMLARDGRPVVGVRRPPATPGKTGGPGGRRFLSSEPIPDPSSSPDLDFRWTEVDLLDRAAVGTMIDRLEPSEIFHLAGAAHVGQSWSRCRETFEANVRTTHYLIDALRPGQSRPRLLIAGSAAVYKATDSPITEQDDIGPASPYATSKLAQEMLGAGAWEDGGVPTLLARAFNHIGPGQEADYVAPSIARQIAMIEAGRADPVLTLGNLDAERDLSDVRDVVRAYAAMMAAARPGVPYNVCSGRPLAIRSLVTMLVARSKVAVDVVQDPARFRPTDAPRLVGSHARLTADTGWAPSIPIEKTLDDLLEYWRERVKHEA